MVNERRIRTDIETGSPSAVVLGKRPQRTNSLDEATAVEEALRRTLSKRTDPGEAPPTVNISMNISNPAGPVSFFSKADGFVVNKMTFNTTNESKDPQKGVDAGAADGVSPRHLVRS